MNTPARPEGARRLPALLCAFVALASLLAGACGAPAVLAHTSASDDDLARAVLAAVERRQVDELQRLAVTKEEFEGVVWPALPASRPEVGMPSGYVWQDTSAKSRAYLGRTLQEFGGQRFELVRVEFKGTTTEHGHYSISRKTHLVVRDATGRDSTIQLFGSVIRQNGRSKVYSYIVD